MSDTLPRHLEHVCMERWPEGAVVYQICPRSWQDTDGDGNGDLRGILQRVDYFKELGVQAVWLSPFYPSPLIDFGYDIADYTAVHPMFGTMADFDALLAALHKRDIRLIIDLAPNHTSSEHAWFQQSRNSRKNEYADWYVWRDAHSDSPAGQPQPPNNWRDALTGGSAWQWDETREQFYLHSFSAQQPDLNWTNPAVRDAIKRVMRFWLDKGVDGFRVDAVYWLGKDPAFTDDPINPDYDPAHDTRYDALLHVNSCGQPMLYSYLQEMASVLKEEMYAASDRFMVTEAYPEGHNPVADYLRFYESMDPSVAAPFNFEGLVLPWKAKPWRDFLQTFHAALAVHDPCCLAVYAFGNHDKSRLKTRLGESAARAAAVMQLTLPGVSCVYYGEEIGMEDVAVPASFVHDPGALGNPGKHGREPQRTPMQWSAEPQAGFSSAARTWLPLAHDYAACNATTERGDPASFFSLYRSLITIRRNSRALSHGMMEVLEASDNDVLAFVRRDSGDEQSYLTLVNFSDQPVTLPAPMQLKALAVSSDPRAMPSDTVHGVEAGAAVVLPANGAALFLVT